MEELFSAMLRRLRLGSNLTQEELAERSGLSSAAVASLERGRRRSPRPSTLRRLARALELDQADLAKLTAAASTGIGEQTTGAVPAGTVSARTSRPTAISLAPEVPGETTDARREWLLPAVAVDRHPYPFVGRDAELSLLTSAWQERRRLVLLTGEAGIGKSRLTARFAADVHSSGNLVTWGRCRAEELGSYEPFVDVIRQVVAATGRGGLEAGVVGRGELTRLMPELASLATDLRQPARGDAGTERRLLFEAVRDLLSLHRPLLVVLEDFHWAGTSTLALLDYLVADASLDELVMVATARDNELTRAGKGSLGMLRSHVALDRLALRGFSRRELSELLGNVLADEPASQLVDFVQEATDGNPFLAETLAVHLDDAGSLSRSDGAPARLRTIPPRAPLALTETLSGRLAGLKEDTVTFLRAASVIGRDFEVSLARLAAGLPDDAIADTVDDALLSGLVSEAGPGWLSFSHALVRDSVRQGLSHTRLAFTHRRLAEALEASERRNPATVGDIARHWAAVAVLDSTYSTKAATWALEAGDAALAAAAVDEAIASYEQATSLSSSATRGRCDALVRLGRALHYAGRSDEADRRFNEALQLARAIGDAELIAEAAIGIGQHFEIGDVDRERVDAIEEALSGIEGSRSHLRPMLLNLLATQLALDRSSEAVARRGEIASEITRYVEDPEASPELLLALGRCQIHTCLRDPYALDRLSERILHLATEVEDLEVLGELWYVRCWSALERADLADLLGGIALGVKIGERRRSERDLSNVAMVGAVLALLQGRYAEAQTLSDEALGRGLAVGTPNAQMIHFSQTALRMADVGEAEVLLPMIRGIEPAELTSIATGTALCAAFAGDHGLARSIIHDLSGRLSELADDIEGISALAFMAHTCAQIDERRHAPELYGLLSKEAALFVRTGPLSGSWGPIAHHLGALARLQNELDAAEEHLRTALVIEDQLEALPFKARTETELARILSCRGPAGREDEARVLAADALSIASGIGARQIADDARRVAQLWENR